MSELLESIDPEIYAELDRTEKLYTRRALLISHIGLGKNIKDAAKAVAKATGGNQELIRKDWYLRYRWGPSFFNLDSPENVMIDFMTRLEGIDTALKYEYAKAMPQARVERDSDGVPLKDSAGAVIQYTEDKGSKIRLGILRARRELVSWTAEFVQKVGLLPTAMQPGHLVFPKDIDAQDTQVMDIDEAQEEYKSLKCRLDKAALQKKQELNYAKQIETESKGQEEQEEKHGKAEEKIK